MPYKIAAVTQDGQKISSHFGMAPSYRVFTIDGGQILTEEERAKPHHEHHPGEGHHHPSHHETGRDLHGDMFAPITDCTVLLCGGMGQPAYQKAQAAGLEVVLTGGNLREAVQAYLEGDIRSDSRRIHIH